MKERKKYAHFMKIKKENILCIYSQVIQINNGKKQKNTKRQVFTGNVTHDLGDVTYFKVMLVIAPATFCSQIVVGVPVLNPQGRGSMLWYLKDNYQVRNKVRDGVQKICCKKIESQENKELIPKRFDVCFSLVLCFSFLLSFRKLIINHL